MPKPKFARYVPLSFGAGRGDNMPDILILHSAGNRTLAATLASDLESQGFSAGCGHGLIGRQTAPEEIARQIDDASAVIALWTRDSVANEGMRAGAATAQSLGKLISVRMSDIAVSKLPASLLEASVFLLVEHANLYSALKEMIALHPPRPAPEPVLELAPADVAEAIPAAPDPEPAGVSETIPAAPASCEPEADAVAPPPPGQPETGAVPPPAPDLAPAPAASASVAEASGAAPGSLKRRAEAQAVPKLAKEFAEPQRLPKQPRSQVQAGKLVENVPRYMRTGAASVVEVRLSRKDTEALTAGLKGEVHKHDILTTPAMTVTLQAPEGGFIIQSLSRETQWIDGSSHAKLGLLSQADFGCWKWIVTPLGSGMRRLDIVAAAKTSEGGVQAETPLPEQIVHVQVRVNYLQAFKELGQWAAVAAAGGLVAEYAATLFKLVVR